MSDRRTVHRVCPFCEATCGLAVEVEGDAIVSVRGDKDDPFSRGYICPKAHGLKELYHDPDRLRQPMRRTASGWEEITWEQAYDEVALRLLAIREKHGNDAIGMYTGNPVAPVEVTADLMPGVVSLPHGWGHDVQEVQLRVAKVHAGVNTNLLTDNQAYDAASGTAVLFGTPVTVEAAPPPSG